MRLKKKIFLFVSVIISLLAVASLSGCSSITVGGKTLKRPDEITLYRLGLYSPFSTFKKKSEIDNIYSFFNKAEFVLSNEVLTEADGNVIFEEDLELCFGNDTYYVTVAENGKAECSISDTHYITTAGAVDYNGLKTFVDNEIQKYLNNKGV